MAEPSHLLDRIDHEILTLLQKDARLSNKELAATVGLAASSCHARVQRLVDDRVIRGFHAVIDPEAVGVRLQAIVSIQLASHGGSRIDTFRDFLLDMDEVLELFQVGGSIDLLVRIAARDTEHLRRVVLDGISAHGEVRHVETAILFDHRRAPSLPAYANTEE